MSVCPNCDSAIPDYQPCPWCELAHAQLLDRLNGRGDGALSIAIVAGWAVFERRVERQQAAWRVQ